MNEITVSVPCRSVAAAKELALRLQADEHRVVRRFRRVSARAGSRVEAALLVHKLRRVG